MPHAKAATPEPPALPSGLTLHEIQIIDIAVGYNPRGLFDKDGEGGLIELANSILNQGLLQPIVVRPNEGDGAIDVLGPVPPNSNAGRVYKQLGEPSKGDVAELHRPPYILVAGERRLRATRDILKRTTITAIIRTDLGGSRALEMTVLENLQRRDLHPMEEARGLASLRAQYGYTADELSNKTGRSRAWIKDRLELTILPQKTQDLHLKSPTGMLTLARLQELAKLMRGGPDNKGFPELVDAVATSLERGTNLDSVSRHLNNMSRTHPHLVTSISHRGKGDGSYGANYFDTQSVCKKCPFAAYRQGYYDGVGICMNPAHYNALHAKGKAAFDAEQDQLKARIATDPDFAAQHRKQNPGLYYQQEREQTTGQKAAATRKRHQEQQAGFYPNMQRIKNVIDMIPAVDSIDLAVICAYAMGHHNVGLDAVTLVTKRQDIHGVGRTFLRPDRSEIERLRKLTPLQLVKLTLEAILVTNAMRQRDYDPGKPEPEPVLKLYLDPQEKAQPERPLSRIAAAEAATQKDAPPEE
jgi:ParB/RepB/Spo0J family partition protein